MYVIGVRESKVWRHKPTGRTASIYGACPWYTNAQKAEWEMETRGWTTEMSNNTIGCGRPPFQTRNEAVAFANEWNARVGRPLIS